MYQSSPITIIVIIKSRRFHQQTSSLSSSLSSSSSSPFHHNHSYNFLSCINHHDYRNNQVSQVSSTRSLDIHLHRMSAAFTCFSRFTHYLTSSNSLLLCNILSTSADTVYSTGSKYRQDVCAWQNQKHLKWAKS